MPQTVIDGKEMYRIMVSLNKTLQKLSCNGVSCENCPYHMGKLTKINGINTLCRIRAYNMIMTVPAYNAVVEV